MVLTKEELIGKLQHEVRILLHLISKVDPAKLGYRPTPKQRSLLELLQYLTVFAPIHLRTIKAGVLNMDTWREAWEKEEAAGRKRNLAEIRDALEKQPALFSQYVGSMSDAELRTQMEMFGGSATRGSWLVSIVLCHYVAYRMQLFLYLKACGREELSTVDLWAGVDALPRTA
jgi:uncharacterized damage-inducible protein DinB